MLTGAVMAGVPARLQTRRARAADRLHGLRACARPNCWRALAMPKPRAGSYAPPTGRELVDVDAAIAAALRRCRLALTPREDPPMLRTHGRYDYSPIVARPAGAWPNGQRLAVYVALNLEHYAFGEGLVEDLVPGIPAARRAQQLVARLRQPRRRVAAARAVSIAALPVTLLINSELYDGTAPN